jgi:general secretion pathway protein A
MYLTTFNLKEAPFQADADARFLYLSRGHARARAYMESALDDGEEFVGISGAAGTGKTALAATLGNELGEQVLVMRCSGPQESARAFLQSLLDQCGFLPFRGEKAALLDTLAEYLGEQRAAGRKVLLLFDDAHQATLPVFEALLDLADPEVDGAGLLRTVFIGRPELEQQLAVGELAELMQRMRLQLRLTALSAEQTRGYVVHRLAIAGSQGREIFEPLSIDAVYRHTGGVPKQINLLCDAALQAAAVAGHDSVTAADVREAARQLQWPELGNGTEAFMSGTGASASHHVAQQGTGAIVAPLGHLRVQSAGQLVAEYDLYRGRMMIGRAADADLRIDDRTISRHHCQIICTDEHSVIQDLNSTNGIYVDERRVRRHLLRDGDDFLLGAYQFIYSDLRTPAESARAVRAAVSGSGELSEPEGEATQN